MKKLLTSVALAAVLVLTGGGAAMATDAPPVQSTFKYVYKDYNSQALIATYDGWVEPDISFISSECGVTFHVQIDHVWGPQSAAPAILHPPLANYGVKLHDAYTKSFTTPTEPCEIPKDATASVTGVTKATCDAAGVATFAVVNATADDAADNTDGSANFTATEGHQFADGTTHATVTYEPAPKLTDCTKPTPTPKPTHHSPPPPTSQHAVCPPHQLACTGDSVEMAAFKKAEEANFWSLLWLLFPLTGAVIWWNVRWARKHPAQ